MRRVLLTLLPLMVVTSVVIGCGDDGSTVRETQLPVHKPGPASAPPDADTIPPAKFGAADANTQVKVKVVEYGYEITPATAAGPKVFFEVTNGGSEEHEFVIVGQNARRVYQIERFGPGQTKTLAVELPAGTYSLECHIVRTVQAHSMLGERASFTVT